MAQDVTQLVAAARGFLTTMAYSADERPILVAIVDQLEKTHSALTPSPDTKGAYMGEFQFNFPAYDADGRERMFTPNIPWTAIKEIMAAIADHALAPANCQPESGGQE